MNDSESKAAFMTALTTEHFVLQTAASATVNEAAGRSSLYVLSLSSSLVAIGFASRSRETLLPFLATVLSSVFVLGLFTVVRLVDTTLENMRCLIGPPKRQDALNDLGGLGTGQGSARCPGRSECDLVRFPLSVPRPPNRRRATGNGRVTARRGTSATRY